MKPESIKLRYVNIEREYFEGGIEVFTFILAKAIARKFKGISEDRGLNKGKLGIRHARVVFSPMKIKVSSKVGLRRDYDKFVLVDDEAKTITITKPYLLDVSTAGEVWIRHKSFDAEDINLRRERQRKLNKMLAESLPNRIITAIEQMRTDINRSIDELISLFQI